MIMAGQDKKSGQKLAADKTNAAKSQQYNKNQEKNLVCDEQLVTKYRKPMKVLNTGCTAPRKAVKYLQGFGCQNYSQKRLRELFINEYCTEKTIPWAKFSD